MTQARPQRFVPFIALLVAGGFASAAIFQVFSLARDGHSDDRGGDLEVESPQVITTGSIPSPGIEIDLGEVEGSQLFSRSFAVPNSTDSPWSVERVRTGCACTSCQLESEHILPGEELTGTVTIRSPSADGPFQNAVFVDLKGGARAIQLRNRGNVRTLFSATPASLSFVVDPAADESPRHTVMLKSRAGSGQSSPSCTNLPSWCRLVSISPVANRTGEWEAVLEAAPEANPPPRQESRLEFHSNDDGARTASLAVTLEVRSRIRPNPAQLFFGRVRRGESANLTVTLPRDVTAQQTGDVFPSFTVSPTVPADTTLESEIQKTDAGDIQISFRFASHSQGIVRGEVTIADPRSGRALLPVIADVVD